MRESNVSGSVGTLSVESNLTVAREKVLREVTLGPAAGPFQNPPLENFI